jgi:hypothetical protein
MAFDPGSGGVVIHGSEYPKPPETWRWNGTSWQRLVSAQSPPLRLAPFLVEDLARREVVLFGAGESGIASMRAPGLDTWVFDARSEWRLANLRPKPTGGAYHAVYDAARNQMLLVGFNGLWDVDFTFALLPAPSQIMATWSHSSQGYREVLASGAPPFRGVYGPIGLAFHPPSGLVVLHGDENSRIGDERTWTFDGRAWRGVLYSPRPDRLAVRLVYDNALGELVAYLPLKKELWAWNPSGWRQLAPATPSLPDDASAVAYDVARRRLVVHGADASNPNVPDTQEWDGTRWLRMVPTTPTTRLRGLLAYAPPLGGSVLVGANPGERGEETWVWDGVGWTRMPIQSPSACDADPVRSLAYDPSRQRLLAFHRMSSYSNADPATVLELRVDSLRVDQAFPHPGETIRFSLSLPSQATRPWFLGLSFSDVRGVPLRPSPVLGYEVLPLDPDALLTASLGARLGGTLDALGYGTFALPIPNDPRLLWLSFHAAAFTWVPATASVGAISHGVSLEVVR